MFTQTSQLIKLRLMGLIGGIEMLDGRTEILGIKEWDAFRTVVIQRVDPPGTQCYQTNYRGNLMPLAPLVLFRIFMQRLWWFFFTVRQGKQTKNYTDHSLLP